jgi:hypothetical protein
MQPIWWDLYRAGVDVILNGHAHNYERLEPLDPKGVPDPQRGIRQFVVGTGGRDHRQHSKIMAVSEARNSIPMVARHSPTVTTGGYPRGR